ncbi:MAG: sorbosone dehydrogenase family protein [Pseudobdellovibrionaceae bacterium]
MKAHFTFMILCLSFLLPACREEDASALASDNDDDGNLSAEAPELVRSDFMTGLNNPWDLAFAGDGQVFFTEKCRGLSVRRSNGQIKRIFGSSGSAVVASDFFCQGQSGMNGLALDPDFASNRTLYVYMPSKLSSPSTNRVVKLVLDSQFSTVTSRTDIINDIPFKNSGNSWGGAGSHSGGRIRFGPDGFLYVTTGDNHNGSLPQDLKKLGGKVLRVDRNGAAVAANQTPSGGDPRIFTYGHRNVQGISFHPQNGSVTISEHGPGHSDEVTVLTAGGNGGWDPKPQAGVSCADNYCGYISNNLEGRLTSMTDLEAFPTAMSPLLRNADSAGMGPCTYITGSQWKNWNGNLLVGIMGSGKLQVLHLNASGALVGTSFANLPSARMRSLVQSPDGDLYIATDGGSIWKVSPP